MDNRRRIVMQKMTESASKNDGKVSISKIMREAGYSPNYAKNPHVFKATKKWSEMICDVIPERIAIEQLKKLILAPVVRRQYIKGEIVWETEELDSNAIGKGLDLYFKITGKYNHKEVSQLDEFDSLPDEELDERIKILEAKVKKH
jgi:hypothetical protein